MSLIHLDGIPAIIVRERQALISLTEPAAVADMEKRAAAIAELARRAGLAVPIQNEATFLRADALERLAVLVDEGQAAGEIAIQGRHVRDSDMSVPVPRQRIAEGRSLARTGAVAEMRVKANAKPDEPVSMDAILKQAKRREREQGLRAKREERQQVARDEIATSDNPPYELHCGSLETWRPVDVAAIITDPPYVGDSIPLYRMLRDFAVETLSPGGPLVVMTWQAILPEVIDALAHPELAYRWTISWRYDNNENTFDKKRRVFDCWKPILVYHKDAMSDDTPFLRDEIHSPAPDKDHHAWGQSIEGFERLIRTFSHPGETVCDPFLGAGTTAIAAIAQTRRFVGCDIDPSAIETTQRRLAP